VVALAACGGSSAPVLRPAATSEVVPALEYAVLAGGTWSTTGARGKIVVLDVWATYCKPCKDAFPRLAALARAHPEIDVVGLSVDEADAVVTQYLQEVPATFTIARDPEMTIAKPPMEVTKLPTLIVIDRAGRVRLRTVEAKEADYDALPALVATLSAER
jgi:cytochrome c biogenesis protein CcmG/thiol:disulfide interchange protein DsbE